MQLLSESLSGASAFKRPQATQLKRGKRWDEYEDKQLNDAVVVLGAKNWRAISSYVPGRTPVQCLHRWTKILSPGLIKGHWTEDEDNLLRDWVSLNGPIRWSECSKKIQGRNGKQCRERWNNTLDPNLKKGGWLYSEDLKIIELYNTLGGKWCQMCEFLPGRSENAIKNRFYSNLRKMINMKKKHIDPDTPTDICQIAGRHEVPMSYDEYMSRRTLSIAQSLFPAISCKKVPHPKPDFERAILCPKAIRLTDTKYNGIGDEARCKPSG